MMTSIRGFIIAAILIVAMVTPCRALQWTIVAADTTGDIGRFCSLVLDSTGRPHISYRNSQDRLVWYLTGEMPAFTRELLFFDPGPPPWSGTTTSIALGVDNVIGVAYGTTIGNRITYRERVAGVWNFEWQESAGATSSSLTFDGENRPHVVYGAAALLDRHRVDDGWTNDPIGTGSWSSIKCAFDGSLSVAYQGPGDLAFAEPDTAGWNIVLVDTASNTGWYTSLAIDSSGTPHIAHFHSGPHDLRYATRVSGQWQLAVIDTAGPTGYYPSIATDRNGNPWIAYSVYLASETMAIKLAVKSGGVWTITAIDTVRTLDEVGLGLDAFGRAHVTYYDGWTGDLMYAVSDPATGVGPSQIGGSVRLAIWPNPSTGSVSMALAGLSARPGRVAIFDVTGRFVRRLEWPVGAPSLDWDARDESGRPVAAGAYLARALAGERQVTGRIVLLR
jgi:hypothetical protein